MPWAGKFSIRMPISKEEEGKSERERKVQILRGEKLRMERITIIV